jgi:hypothetical protein
LFLKRAKHHNVQKINFVSMRIYSPLFIAIRLVIYALLITGMAEAIRFDAAFPMEEGYFGEISLTEIFQEIILFILFIFYIILGYRYKKIQPVANMLSVLYLISFIREFNFLMSWWIYPVIIAVAVAVWLIFRDFKKIKEASVAFFKHPASSWFMAGFLITYIFSRLFGRSSFWRLLYNEDNYRLAKAAAEEGIELLGDSLMLIAAIEFIIALKMDQKKHH